MPDFIVSIGLNWVDYIIIVALIFYAIEGYAVGFVASLLDLISFIAAFIIGLKVYFFIGKFIQNFLSISAGFSNALGFLVSASIAEIILSYILRRFVYRKYLSRVNLKGSFLKGMDKFFGFILGVLSGIILFSFILTVIVALPISVFLKHSVSSSKIGNLLVLNASGFEKDLNLIFGGAVHETLNFLTVEPKSDDSVNLKFRTDSLKVDAEAEQQMLNLVNKERELAGLKIVEWGRALQQVARAHCTDMFRKGYFSHYTLEGLSPFDRMVQADIFYAYAGENLALAPNVETAMQGLMKSPGHKANILSENFGTLGVGVIDGGIYGQMYCQEFTD